MPCPSTHPSIRIQPHARIHIAEQLPEILVVHLKRFSFEGYRGKKISQHIRFPVEQLDLDPYCASDTHDGAVYRLFGVTMHWGSFEGGHYTAVCRHPAGARWLAFNDSVVRIASESDLCGRGAYILFYERVHSDHAS
jgi:ubiquitin C-terminal hydrolase